MKRAYWRAWWWFSDRRTRLFVREALRHLRNNEVVYIHPSGEEGFVAVLATVGAVDAVGGLHAAEPHSHLEGGRLL